MNIIIWIVMLVAAFLSIALMLRIQSIKSLKKYTYFRYLSYVLVSWTFVTILRYVVIEPFMIYHLTFLIYPIVFLITCFLYLTIKIYLGRTISNKLKILLIVFFVIDLVLSLTNSFHHLMLDVDLTDSITTVAFNTVSIGPLFYVHTIACYILMFIGLYELMTVSIVNFKNDRDVYPFILLSSSIVLGVILNVIHIFFYTFTIDPTYIFIVIVVTIMHDIFKNRDINLIIDANRNRDILNRISELYIISDHKGFVVNCSENMQVNCDRISNEKITLSDIKKELEETAILYKTEKDIPDEFDASKKYYHVKEQRIRMPHFKYYGMLTLLYDETSDIKLIHEMDRIMSYDLMTGLYNRNYFENQIPILENEDTNYGLIIFDVDGLKLRNDYLGHKSGDELLISFSRMILKVSEKYKDLTPIRLGGDEFLVISKNGAKERLKVIADELTKLGVHSDPLKNISFSYGIANRSRSNMRFSTVLKEADANLYLMKENKKEIKKQTEEYFKTLETIN